MQFNLTEVPFSCRGSYLAVSVIKGDLYFRTVHGNSSCHEVFKIIPLVNENPVEYQIHAAADRVEIVFEGGKAELCFARRDVLLFRAVGNNVGLCFDIWESERLSGYNFVHEIPYGNKSYYMMNLSKNAARFILHTAKGHTELKQEWVEETSVRCRFFLTAENGILETAVEDVPTEWEPENLEFDFDAAHQNMRQDFEAFYNKTPSVPAEYESSRELAAYIMWSSIVAAEGLLKRDAMFMSKNWMTSIWSWDHCFNALALSYGHPQEAFDQFMCLFDFQLKSGALPDNANDASLVWTFCKPPIHGWIFRKMMQHIDFTEEQLLQVYEKMSLWTKWWLKYRDLDKNGVCEYYHGNDSGWDNATVFRLSPAMETPDLAAFLILQTEVLCELAEKLVKPDEADQWKRCSEHLFDSMLSVCFKDNMPVARISRTKEIVENESLFLYLPILLGHRLPDAVLQNLLNGLKSDKFLTPHGFATEAVNSSFYRSDGYWRGPIWAPSSYIIIDGLREAGETELARDAAKRFCRMAKENGFAENYDALTGHGLRDRAYTWTSSVFLVLAHEFLLEPEL